MPEKPELSRREPVITRTTSLRCSVAFSASLKKRVRQKAHYRCCLCQAVLVEVHHIVPQGEGGPDEEDNAAPLCASCHEIYGANPTKRKFIREARDLVV